MNGSSQGMSPMLPPQYRKPLGAGGPANFDSFEQEFSMPPDIASIDSDISK